MTSLLLTLALTATPLEPGDVLRSGLANAALVEVLTQSRNRAFRRISDEALSAALPPRTREEIGAALSSRAADSRRRAR